MFIYANEVKNDLISVSQKELKSTIIKNIAIFMGIIAVILFLVFIYKHLIDYFNIITSILLIIFSFACLIIILAISNSFTTLNKILPIFFILQQMYIIFSSIMIIIFIYKLFILNKIVIFDIQISLIIQTIIYIIFIVLMSNNIDKNIKHISQSSQNINSEFITILDQYEKDRITPNETSDFSINNINNLKIIYDNFIQQYNTNFQICNSYLELRIDQFNNASTDISNLSSSISNLLKLLNKLYDDAMNQYNSTNAKLQDFLNIKNNFNTQVNNMYNMIQTYKNNYINIDVVSNLTSTFIFNNIDNLKIKLLFLLQFFQKNIHTIMHRGQAYMQFNNYYLNTYGLTIRNDINNKFNDMNIHDNDKLYLLKDDISNLSIENNVIDMFNDNNIQLDNYELIYNNNNLVSSSIANINWNNIKYGTQNNKTSIITAKFAITYDKSNNKLIVAYNSNPYNIYVFAQNDIFKFPDKYINYNLNVFESYLYNDNSKNIYLQSNKITHEFNEKLWNLYSEDINNNRITHAQLINTSIGAMSFVMLNNQSIHIDIPSIKNGHILYIEENDQKYIMIFSFENIYIYKINTNNLINENNNYVSIFNTNNAQHMNSPFISAYSDNNRISIINKINSINENIYGNFNNTSFDSHIIDSITI